jgi:dTMP kinase
MTREPGGTALGNRLRATFVEPGLRIDPLAEAFVVNASRAQHVTEIIEPALAAGRGGFCDRFTGATLAYQGYGRGIDIATLRLLASVATRGRVPDLTLLLDIEVDVSFERVRARAEASGEAVDRLEREGSAFHMRVRAGYLELAREDATFVLLDARLGRAELLTAAWRVLQAKYGI